MKGHMQLYMQDFSIEGSAKSFDSVFEGYGQNFVFEQYSEILDRYSKICKNWKNLKKNLKEDFTFSTEFAIIKNFFI